jgi:hypothetical protein
MAEITFYSKDIQIMRQSQQKIALDYLSSMKVTATLEELQRVTDVFVECCLRPQDESLKTRVKNLDKWIKTKQVGV